MTEPVIRFLIPIACGYLVFVTFSNKLLPWPRPKALLSRPRWLLGCCCGAAVSACLMLLMHFSYGKTLQELMVVAPPLTIIFLSLTAGSVLAWLGYRKRCLELAAAEDSHFEAAYTDYEIEQETTQRVVESGDIKDNGIDLESYDLAFNAAYRHTQQALPIKISQNQETLTAASNENDVEGSSETAALDDANSRPLGFAEQEFLQQAQQLAKQQYELRCEVEKNLRITRKALLKLESERHEEEAGKSENELLLENKLQEQIRNTTKAENRLLREVDRIGQLQARLAVSKDLVVEAKAEVRTNMEARSNAILTARKSVNFAKRSLEARDRAERKLENLKIQLDIQSQTTSKVIKSLELEKQKTRQQDKVLASLQGEQETAGLRKIQRDKTSKPWLSRMTRDNAGKSRIVRKLAQYNTSEAAHTEATQAVDAKRSSTGRKATEA